MKRLNQYLMRVLSSAAMFIALAGSLHFTADEAVAQPAQLKEVEIQPTSVEGGEPIEVIIRLTKEGTMTVKLNSSNNLVSVQPPNRPVHINNASSKSIFLNTRINSGPFTIIVTITVSAGAIQKTANVSVTPGLQPPELLAPAHNYLSFDGKPTFRCGASQSQGVMGYRFCISEQSYNGPCETSSRSVQYITSSNTQREYDPWVPLPFRGVIAKWHVHAWRNIWEGSVFGPPTPDRTLRLALPSAELTLPNANAQVGNRPEFRWQSVLGATRYKIVVTGGPKRQKKEYVLSSKHPSFDSRSFIPPASDPIPFSGTVTWSVNAYNDIVPHYSKPVGSQIRKMVLPTTGGKTLKR